MRLLLRKSIAQEAPYKKFSASEISALKKMKISDELVAAMIAVTTEYSKEQKRIAEQQRNQASQAPAKQVQQVMQQPVQQVQQVKQQQAPESNTLADCVKLAAALKACDYSGLFSMPCKAVARSQFSCSSMP